MVFKNYKLFDFCGSIVGLSYKGNRRYKSAVGGILTILCSLAILLLLIIYGIDFFERARPNFVFEDIKYYQPPRLDISNKFSFIIMTQYAGVTEMRPDVVNIEAWLRTRVNNTWVVRTIESIPCVPTKTISKAIFDKQELSKGACFNMSGLSIEGSNVNDVFEYLQIKFSLCTDKDTCYPKDQMPKFFEETKPLAMIYFVDTAFQIYNFNQRAIDFYNYLDNNISYTDVKQSNIYFSLNEMLVDENYYFPSTPTNYSELMIESFRDKVSTRPLNNNELYLYNFMSSKYKRITHISYMRLSELLANVCSLVNLIIIVGTSIGYFFNHYFFQSDLINSFYEFEGNDNLLSRDAKQKMQNFKTYYQINQKTIIIENKSQANSKKTKEIIYNLNNRSTQTPNISTDQSNFAMELKNNEQKSNITTLSSKPTKRIQLSYSNTIKAIIASMIPCVLSHKNKTGLESYYYLCQSILVYQDLINVYRKLMEFDLLKYLMLNEDQMALFQIVPKMLYTNPKDIRASNDFMKFVHSPNQHFFKNRRIIKEILNANPEYKALLIPKYNSQGSNIVQEKLVKLII